MLILSFGGKTVDALEGPMRVQIDEFRGELDPLGVKHGDLESRNMLGNEKLQRPVFTDFERIRRQSRSNTIWTTAQQGILSNKVSMTNSARKILFSDIHQVALNNSSSV